MPMETRVPGHIEAPVTLEEAVTYGNFFLHQIYAFPHEMEERDIGVSGQCRVECDRISYSLATGTKPMTMAWGPRANCVG